MSSSAFYITILYMYIFNLYYVRWTMSLNFKTTNFYLLYKRILLFEYPLIDNDHSISTVFDEQHHVYSV